MREFLSQKGVKFREVDVTRDQYAAQEMVNRTGQRGVPVTVIDGQTIIGFDRARIEQALSMVQARHPTFGVAVADASKFGRQQGAYIGKLRPGSTAERMGLRVSDVVTRLNNQTVSNAADLEKILSSLGAGSRLSVTYMRDNQSLLAEGTLA